MSDSDLLVELSLGDLLEDVSLDFDSCFSEGNEMSENDDLLVEFSLLDLLEDVSLNCFSLAFVFLRHTTRVFLLFKTFLRSPSLTTCPLQFLHSIFEQSHLIGQSGAT